MQNDLELYKREDLLDHMKNPYNQGILPDATVKAFEVNPMCGDEITLYLKLNEQGTKITNAKFTGHTCGVCTLSASLLTENIIDGTVEHAKNLTKTDILKLIDINLSTSRIKCATLPLEALLKGSKKLLSTKYFWKIRFMANKITKKIKEPKADNNSVPNNNPVHKHMNISEIVNKYPQAEEILLDYGLHCVGCFASAFDTLEAGALIHGITDEELEEMVDRINEAILYEE